MFLLNTQAKVLPLGDPKTQKAKTSKIVARDSYTFQKIAPHSS